MNSNKKIIILIVLVIFIIVSFSYIVSNQMKDTGLKNINTNLLQIQAKAKQIKEKSVLEENANLLIGQAVPDYLLEKFNLKEDEDIENLIVDMNSANIEKENNLQGISEIRILTLEDLNMLGLSSINEDMKYIVDYGSGEVYYIDGVKNEKGEIYYKLSEINEIVQD